MREPVDVLICGAGAAGLTLAIDLARRGVRFVLVEKLPSPFQGSRGKGIQPRTQEIFEDLGILDRAMAAGGIYPTVRKYTVDGRHVDQEVTSVNDPTPAEPYRLPLMVPQFKTEAVMRERLIELGHAPEFGVELTRMAVIANGIEAVLTSPEGEETLRARYLVGADGGRSFVRSTLGIGFPGKTLGVRAIVADVVLEGLSRDVWHQFDGGDAGPMAICPLAGTGLFQIQAPVPLDGDIDLSAAGLTERVALHTKRTDVVVRSVAWSSTYNMNARLADRYRDGPVFLVGDAAHVHPPTGGQGLNTSVQDAYNLGWKLAAVLAGAPEALLETYEAERRPLAADVLDLSTRLLAGFKTGDNRRSREVQQLDIGYPTSPLSFGGRSSTLAPGARAPDAAVQGAGGIPTRLFNLFKGTHWTLLVNGTSSLAPHAGLHIHRIGSGMEIEDRLGQFARFYGLEEGASALVRPDGYLAGVFARDQIAALRDHVDRYCN
ncbi:FAD-dependent oxidoreductase [Achromobacter aloeverae]|uniref:2-polyprenyl-6-methoxyphenol hydroxylase n=1 Tax=Achromobacter aloeverae TaxID=1750518 RepID=A0A4Q1HLP0_9BURK|nr:FAD-dependent oxidoreductase [Achromobacter aloeverae]RXN91176.1 2-polyprenyl-6-methoxyphenol hydroxylase [Achromobacter aloeverae]